MSEELAQFNHHKFFDELSALIDQGKQKLTFAANSTLTLLFWNLGKRINEEVLHNNRAEDGKRNSATAECKSFPNPRQDTVTYAHSVQNQCPILRVSLSHMPSLLEKHHTTSLPPALFPPSPFLSPSYL